MMQAFQCTKGVLAMAENDEVTGRAKGGIARAKALSDEERAEIAKKAAEARWGDDGIEIAKYAGELEIGDMKVLCAVLADGTRVLSERAVTKAFGGKRGGSHWRRLKANPGGANLPIFLSAKNIQPFLNKDLMESLGRRRIYRPKRGGAPAHGLEATLLPKICNVFLSMRDTSPSSFHPSQIPFIAAADILMRGLGEIGIIALVDEATGHIEEKRKDEYRQLFKDFIREQVRNWEKEFPDQFFDALYRLYNVPNRKDGRHPQFFGHFIRKYIYHPVADSKGAVLELLDEKNPVVYANGGRRYKMHQFLTDLVGVPAFRAHLWQTTGIANSCVNKAQFERAFARAFPGAGHQYELIAGD